MFQYLQPNIIKVNLLILAGMIKFSQADELILNASLTLKLTKADDKR
jgi:hypothetical protein